MLNGLLYPNHYTIWSNTFPNTKLLHKMINGLLNTEPFLTVNGMLNTKPLHNSINGTLNTEPLHKTINGLLNTKPLLKTVNRIYIWTPNHYTIRCWYAEHQAICVHNSINGMLNTKPLQNLINGMLNSCLVLATKELHCLNSAIT